MINKSILPKCNAQKHQDCFIKLLKKIVLCQEQVFQITYCFLEDGENETPITHQDIDSSKLDYLPVDLWQKYASPVWYDIDYSRTLQYRSGRDGNDEKHIAPLQLDTIERILHLYSNEGETVLSPFGGIGSEGCCAIKMNRKSISIELKESYFALNAKNHKDFVSEKNATIKLF